MKEEEEEKEEKEQEDDDDTDDGDYNDGEDEDTDDCRGNNEHTIYIEVDRNGSFKMYVTVGGGWVCANFVTNCYEKGGGVSNYFCYVTPKILSNVV